ncbi:heme/copper-type cytochrome/quinol oxidase subunit 3 [Virgibacillus natechei]|uniref:Heme/copper-type cytochrome/quinol oxidase subunit 3 n=1 Tax=Virgibacillus natechei TaxID=1216297 RepID=A0ABS4IK79_9BACI|nr:hypothetical protein [Virgibacillus natechei]MBP1971324.1 heme/copper-type cytochrome/quinol oxidase subunit 3 [Virgibacillus natechei]UZD12941.1 hypothetical protein OLD84_18995 [Virgibacillus natechei]
MKLKGIYLFNITVLALFGWAMVAFYDTAAQIKSTIDNPNIDGFALSLNVLPLILLLIVGIPAGVVLTRKQRKEKKGWKAAILLPAELKENDEREKALTSKACRDTYISTMIAFPFLAALMLFQPFVSSYFAAYPIVILMLFPIIQVTVFYLSLRKNYAD